MCACLLASPILISCVMWCYCSPSGCTFWGKKQWSRKKKILLQLAMLVGGPIGISFIAIAAVPAIIIGLPVWVGRKVRLNPLTAHCCHMGTATKHPVPYCRLNRSLVIFVIRALLTLSPENQSARLSNITNDSWINPVWHRMLCSCTDMAAVGVKGLTLSCLLLVFPRQKSLCQVLLDFLKCVSGSVF